jgi:dCMP deaminase
MNGMKRPSWPEFAMKLAYAACTRSEDPYVRVGACVLRKDYSVGGVGYNGGPSGVEIDWSDRDTRRQYVIHAETNALRYISPGEGELLAVTLLPCTNCLTLIASYRISDVYYSAVPRFGDPAQCIQVARHLGIQLHHIPPGHVR